MNEMLRYTIIRVILFVMGGFLVLGCSDEDDVDNSGGTSKYGLIRMAEEDYDSSNTSYILQDEEPDEVLFDSSQRKFKENNENQRIARIAAEQMFFQSYSRYLDLFRFTPEERYLQLLKKCPAILQMVSLKEIASYLKITPIHMSRIRRKQSFDNKK